MRSLTNRSLIILLVLAIAVLIGPRILGIPGVAGTAVALAPDEEEGLISDAAAYAERYGVEQEEALRRLRLEREAGALNAALEANERPTLAGLWIQHQPDFRIIASFTQ